MKKLGCLFLLSFFCGSSVAMLNEKDCSPLNNACDPTGGVSCCDGLSCEKPIGSSLSYDGVCKGKVNTSCQKNSDCSSLAPTCRNGKCSKAILGEKCQADSECVEGLKCGCGEEICSSHEMTCLKK